MFRTCTKVTHRGAVAVDDQFRFKTGLDREDLQDEPGDVGVGSSTSPLTAVTAWRGSRPIAPREGNRFMAMTHQRDRHRVSEEPGCAGNQNAHAR